MEGIRNAPPAEIAGLKVTQMRDYLTETITNTLTGEKTPTGLPVSNVLYFATEGDNVVVIRPSGTEPKIKLYLLVNGKDKAECSAVLESFKNAVQDWTK